MNSRTKLEVKDLSLRMPWLPLRLQAVSTTISIDIVTPDIIWATWFAFRSVWAIWRRLHTQWKQKSILNTLTTTEHICPERKQTMLAHLPPPDLLYHHNRLLYVISGPATGFQSQESSRIHVSIVWLTAHGNDCRKNELKRDRAFTVAMFKQLVRAGHCKQNWGIFANCYYRVECDVRD